MNDLIITKELIDGILNVSLEGRVDIVTAPELDKQVRASLEGVNGIVLNFEKIDYISSSGLRVLLGLHKTMTQKGGTFVVRKPTEMVLEVLEVTGFTDMFEIEE